MSQHAVRIARDHCLAPERVGAPIYGGRYRSLFHDITADRSPVTHRADADRIRNFRVPRANLEGLYGSGPVGSPYLYA